MKTDDRTHIFKIAVVGSGSVGKTSTILRYTTDTFTEQYIPTLGVGLANKDVDLPEGNVRLVIWDMGGQEHLGGVRANFYKGATGVIFVYDVTQPDSFDEISDWKKEVDASLIEYESLLIANKIDLKNDKSVSREEGEQLGNEIGATYLETSAKIGLNIEEAFKIISKLMIDAFHML
ncbi:MAG: Rab family GTPase [Candidatus Thorarchaeota archaeon]